MSYEVREHLLDDWSKFISVIKLSDKLNKYDSDCNSSKKPDVNPLKDKINEQ